MLNSFITSSIKQNKINAQEFWELREFYAPGVITVNKTATITPFLNFKSSKITSQESLIPKYRQDDILPRPSHNQQVDFRTKTDIIYHDSQTVHIVFVKPISEMVTANAVYDYKDKDKKFLEGKLWFVEMTINTQ